MEQFQNARRLADASIQKLHDREAEAERVLSNAQAEAKRIVAEALGKAKEIMKTADERTVRADAARDQALAAIEALEALGRQRA